MFHNNNNNDNNNSKKYAIGDPFIHIQKFMWGKSKETRKKTITNTVTQYVYSTTIILLSQHMSENITVTAIYYRSVTFGGVTKKR